MISGSTRQLNIKLGSYRFGFSEDTWSGWLIDGRLSPESVTSYAVLGPPGRRQIPISIWPLLESATIDGPDRFGMPGKERALLYRTAIQSGLRANELRSLKRESLVLGATQPYVVLDAASAKNRRSARVQIDKSLADLLRDFLAAKLPNCEAFQLPHASNLARMLRRDLAYARKRWIADAKQDPQELTRRQESDFLATENHSGHLLDFHSLRHTCGGWLANSGAHPKTVQAVMRHSTNTLTMDRYGHLLPGAETDAATQLGEMVSLRQEPEGSEENILRMTGTDAGSAQRQAQQSGRDSTRREDATCDEWEQARDATKKPKALTAVALGDEGQADAAACESAPIVDTNNLRNRPEKRQNHRLSSFSRCVLTH